MQEIDALRRRFSVEGVAIEPGEGGLTRVSVKTPAAQGEIYLHGAHVTRFRPTGQREMLFMSGKSHFQPGKAIRGGVPVIFPWFGPKSDDPAAPQHGLVRNVEWTLKDVKASAGGGAEITLGFDPSDSTRALWPHEFALTFTATFGPSLEMAMQVRNVGQSTFSFEQALHTYLAVSDVRNVKIEGLTGRAYIDKVDAAARKTEAAAPITITAETDRVYLNSPDAVVIHDPGGEGGRARTLTVAKEGSLSTIVWNPWIAKARAMPDFGDDEWPKMLCIESANAADNAVSLPPGQQHEMRAVIRV